MSRPSVSLTPTQGALRGAVGLVALVVLGLSGWFVVSATGDLPANAVLRYNGRTITQSDLSDRVQVLSALYGVQAPEGGAKRDEFDRQAAKSYAVGLILARDAIRRGTVISDKQANDQLDSLIEEQLQGGRDAFVEFLQTSGISEVDVLDEIKRQLATARIVEEVTADLPAITDTEVGDFYEENKSKMVTAQTRTLDNIVVADEAQANEIAALARQGSDFSKLAKKYSADGSTKDKGGALGEVTEEQLDPAFAEQAFAADSGAIFGPVQTQFGWNIGRVVSITPARALELDEVAADLKTELENKARLTTWRAYLGKLLKSAEVEYADKYRPDDPDAAPSDLPQETQ